MIKKNKNGPKKNFCRRIFNYDAESKKESSNLALEKKVWPPLL